MTLTHIANLLCPLTNSIALQSWEDAEDLAREISRLARLKRLQEAQAIQEAVNSQMNAKAAPGGSQVANPPPVGFNSEIAYRQQVNTDKLLKALEDPAKAKAAQEAGWNLEELKQAAEIAYRPEPGITLETRFDETGHYELWRNEVATELNWILGLAESRQRPYEIDYFAAAALSIAARVAQFEEIRVL